MWWWIWILLGLALLGFESMTPTGFFVFFFGVSALLVGGLTWTFPSLVAQTQWVLFSIFSVASLLLLRPRLKRRKAGDPEDEMSPRDFVGEPALLLGSLEPGGVAKAELRGTSWNVRSTHPSPIPSGSRCLVQRVEGLTLWVGPPKGDH